MAELEIPVAAQSRSAGQVFAGRDISAGQLSEIAQHLSTALALSEITAVEQDVRVISERVRPAQKLILLHLQAVGVQGGIAQGDRGIAAVGNDMDGADIGEVLQRLGDLPDAITVAVELDDLETAALVRTCQQ